MSFTRILTFKYCSIIDGLSRLTFTYHLISDISRQLFLQAAHMEGKSKELSKAHEAEKANRKEKKAKKSKMAEDTAIEIDG